MGRFERLNHCLTPVPTVHAAAAWFCRLHQKHEESMDDLSRHDLELDTDDLGFKVEHTAMG